MGERDDYEAEKAAWASKDAAPPSAGRPLTAAKLTTEEAEIPISVVPKGSKKKLVIIVIAAVVGVAGAAAGFGYFQNQRARKQTEAAFGELSQCLIGESNADAGQVAVKYRKHQVVLMGRTSDERSDGSAPWPDRCAKAANKVVDASSDAGLASDNDKSLNGAANELSKALQEKRGLDNDMSSLIKATWDQALAAKVKPAPSSVAGPPAHRGVMVVDDIPEAAFLTREYVALSTLHSPAHPSEEPIFLFDQKGSVGPFYCKIQPERLSCKKLPGALAKVGHALTLLGSADPGVAPLLFAGNRGDAGVYRGDTGILVDRLQSVGGYARKDGAVILLGVEDGKMVLSIQKSPSDKATRFPLDDELGKGDGPKDKSKGGFDDTVNYENGYFNTMLAHGALYIRLWGKDGWRLWSVPVGPDGHLQKPTKIGTLEGLVSYAGVDPGMVACRTADSRRALRVHQSDKDFVAFFADGTWSHPIEGNGLFGADMECSDARASFVTSYSVTSCTSAACDNHLTAGDKTGSELQPRNGANDRAMASDALVAVWGAGVRGGIRSRRASVQELGKGQDVVVLDDLISNGKIVDLPTITELRVLSAGADALVLLQTKDGLAAMRIGADGEMAPDTIVWQ